MEEKKKKKVKSKEAIYIYANRDMAHTENVVRESSDYIVDYVWDEIGCLKEYSFNRI